MKRVIALLLTLFLAMGNVGALASNFYIIPDSDSRRSTREELWQWQYDALGFILNEIFARHGFHFKPGEKFDNYFRSQSWYQPNPAYDNQGIYANLMTNIEWANERLVKEVREEMRALGTTNPDGKPLPQGNDELPIHGAFSSFAQVHFEPNQKLAVYSGPGEHYYRSANGKAMASTNGDVYVGGWENGWLLVMYWANENNIRVGYTSSNSFKEQIQAPLLQFAYTPTTIAYQCTLTDDPVATYQMMATLHTGMQVTYLAEYVRAYSTSHEFKTSVLKPLHK